MANAAPNIILVTCHDLGQHLGCYGQKTVHSPNIDKLAGEGIRFANSFCTAPQCSPSRASIYTGRYPHNNGVMGLTHHIFAWDLNPDEKHLATRLGEAGYHTELIGIQHETSHPEKIGYDYLKPMHFCNDIADESINRLQKLENGEKPFYLQIGFFEPHRPFNHGGAQPDEEHGVAVPEFIVDEPPSREEFAAYQGAIRKMDAQFGRFLDALKKSPAYGNTIIIFTVDHGMPFPRAKCSLYDKGIEVPFIIRWPARNWIGGMVREELLSNVDITPTLLEAVGLPIPANVQGQSMVPLLDGKPMAERTEIHAELTYHGMYNPIRAVRTRTHKLIANFTPCLSFQDPSQTWRPKTITTVPENPAAAFHPYLELYDLAEDPLEQKNLADSPEHADMLADMRKRLRTWMENTDDPVLQGKIPVSPFHRETVKQLLA